MIWRSKLFAVAATILLNTTSTSPPAPAAFTPASTESSTSHVPAGPLNSVEQPPFCWPPGLRNDTPDHEIDEFEKTPVLLLGIFSLNEPGMKLNVDRKRPLLLLK